jgi:GNAT superfamily N-acetyltransferase
LTLTIRPATPDDTGTILFFIRELAEYEKLLHEVVATEADLERDLFGPSPKVFCELAELNGKPVGFALWYYTYSTFQGRHGLYLEDLYVLPETRGQGVGKALLVELARRCVSERLGRYEWSVLDWNEPSIAFYKAQGGALMSEWIRVRVTGPALEKLGAT